MALPRERIEQLDGLVRQMQANGEADAYIQSVVDDFKSHYEQAKVGEIMNRSWQPSDAERESTIAKMSTGFEETYKKRNLLSSIVGTAKTVVKDIGSSFTEHQDKSRDILKRAVAHEENPIVAGAELAGQGFATLSDTIAAVLRPVAEPTVKALYNASVEIRNLVERGDLDDLKKRDLEAAARAMETSSQAWEKFKKTNPNIAGTISAALNIGEFATNIVGGGVAAKEAGAAAKQSAKLAGKTVVEGAEAAGRGLKTVASVADPLVDTLKSGANLAKTGADDVFGIAKRVGERVATNRAAKQVQRDAVAALPVEAQNAVKNGVDIGDANLLLKKSSRAERKLQREMLEAARSGSGDPAEIAGNALRANLTKIEEIAQEQGRKLGELAQGISADKIKGVRDSVIQNLRQVPGLEGLTISPTGKLNFADTRLSTSLTSGDRKFIQSAVDGIKGKGGKGLHKLRQELFEALRSAEKGQKGFVDTSSRAVEAVRKGISDALDVANDGYKTLNQEYAVVAQPLEDLRKIFKGLEGASDDVLDAQGGLLMRRLTSNAQSGLKLRKVLETTDEILKKYGKHGDIELGKLQEFSDALHRYYDLTKQNSLAGQVKEGVQGLADLPRSASGVIDKTIGKVADKIGEFTAATPEVRKKAFEELFESVFGIQD